MPVKPSQPQIEDLLGKMRLEEKIGQLTMVRGGAGVGGAELSAEQLDQVRAGRIGSLLDLWAQEGIRRAQEVAMKESRLGIPLLATLDVLHGYRTIFPIPLGEAAAFDPALWKATASAAAAEAAAADLALTYAPMLDVSRDARWGRMAESFGEDPWLGGRFAEAKVRGFQGAASGRAWLAATAKHLGGYGAVMGGREYNSVDISARSLHEVHLPPFLAAVRAGVLAIMPAFNDLAGVPMTANAPVLRGVVRERWGFDGVMISDFGAVSELIAHGVAADLPEAAALALKAGIDIDMMSEAYPKGLAIALERGLVTEALIDEAVRRVLTLKAKLGLFEAPKADAAAAPAARQGNRDLAREAARRSIVLLQNCGELLPLKGEAKRLAVIGPFAGQPQQMLGPWYAAGKADEAVTFLAGLGDALPSWPIDHQPGSEVTEPLDGGIEAAVEATRQADMVLLCIGEAAGMCGEAGSRVDPGIPASQRLLAEAVFSVGKPVIAVLSSGRPLTASWLFEKADAVLATWFLGSEAGNALADILTGRANPSGRLPVCWPHHVGQMPLFYAHRRTGRPPNPADPYCSRYIDSPAEPLFPFGHGLSYTRFAYAGLQLSAATLSAGERLVVEAEIANEGAVDGEETALLFIRDPVASVGRPVLELKGIAKLALAAQTSGTARFELTCDDVGFLDEQGEPVVEPGIVEIFVGPSADRAALLSAKVEVVIR